MAQRSAVAFFLVDTAFLSDPKFRALLRRLPDPDDFNSAVGAYFIALAAARRNGYPALDIHAETESRHVQDLEAVGLTQVDGFPPGPFKEWSAMSPQQAIAGRARAASAVRSTLGTFTSETSALDSGTSVSSEPQRAPAVPFPSLPLDSLPVEEGGAGGGNGHDQRLDGPLAYQEVTLKYPPIGSGLHDWVERLATEYGAATFQKALATEYTINRGLKDLLSRTESRLARAADEATPPPSRNRAETTRRELQAEDERRTRLLTQPMKPLRDLMPDVKLGKP